MVVLATGLFAEPENTPGHGGHPVPGAGSAKGLFRLWHAGLAYGLVGQAPQFLGLALLVLEVDVFAVNLKDQISVFVALPSCDKTRIDPRLQRMDDETSPESPWLTARKIQAFTGALQSLAWIPPFNNWL